MRNNEMPLHTYQNGWNPKHWHQCWQRCGPTGMLLHWWWECKLIPLWKTVSRFLTKVNVRLPYYPQIALLVIYPNEVKTFVDQKKKKTYTWMFIAALSVIAQNWQQPRYPSIGEWINKLWYNHTIENYPVIKRNELSSHEKAWRSLKWMLLDERSQSEKLHTFIWFQLYGILEKAKLYRNNKKMSGCRGLGEGERDEQVEPRAFLGY